MDLQPLHLRDTLVTLIPLREDQFEALYQVAADPLIWEQHPNPDRYKREVFKNFFNGALESQGAFLIRDSLTNQIIGCTRYYDHEPEISTIKIGYTFFAVSCWGKGFNRAAKELMISYAFNFVDRIVFHVGANNLRSRKAMENLGAVLIGMEDVAYYGEPLRTNCVYLVQKSIG